MYQVIMSSNCAPKPLVLISWLLSAIYNNSRESSWCIKTFIGDVWWCTFKWNVWVSGYMCIQILHEISIPIVLQSVYVHLHFYHKGIEYMKSRDLAKAFSEYGHVVGVGFVYRVTLMGSKKWLIWLFYSTNTFGPIWYSSTMESAGD